MAKAVTEHHLPPPGDCCRCSLVADVVGDMAYALGYERLNGSANANGRPVKPITVRSTHIYRREEGEWKIAHRHGDNTPVDPAGAN